MPSLKEILAARKAGSSTVDKPAPVAAGKPLTLAEQIAAKKAATEKAPAPAPVSENEKLKNLENAKRAGDHLEALLNPQVINADQFVHESQPDKFDDTTFAQLKQSINLVADNLADKDIVSQSLGYIVTKLREHPALANNLAPEDIGTMVKGLRASYGTAIKVKEEKKSTRAKKEMKATEIESMLHDVEFNL